MCDGQSVSSNLMTLWHKIRCVSAASCNMMYTAAAEWDGRECKLEDTLFGSDSSVTYGGTPILNDAKLLFANVVTIPSVPLSGKLF